MSLSSYRWDKRVNRHSMWTGLGAGLLPRGPEWPGGRECKAEPLTPITAHVGRGGCVPGRPWGTSHPCQSDSKECPQGDEELTRGCRKVGFTVNAKCLLPFPY
jgi:hypothetical protein